MEHLFTEAHSLRNTTCLLNILIYYIVGFFHVMSKPQSMLVLMFICKAS